jgi:hypothetical protein
MKGPAGRAVWIDGWCTSFGVDVLVHSLSEQKKMLKKMQRAKKEKVALQTKEGNLAPRKDSSCLKPA